MRQPAKIESEQDLYAVALRALTRRAHSVFEMRGYLEKRAAESDTAKTVLARLRESRRLDDARYATEFARFHATIRRQGRFRIVRELRVRGVADQHIDSALEQVFADVDERATIRKLIERRVKAARNGAFDAKRTASLYRTLLRSGFDTDLIRRELKSVLHDVAADLPIIEQSETAE